jgi:hypothetical protein
MYAIITIIYNAHQQYLLEVRETPGETDFTAVHAEGRALTLDQVIAYAVQELRS